ncbi:jg3063 [Pararge aegeria aegeria]|uniref:Jg3063 protein n=1 Tax=Pararge aegeria aegeria TaxID=348720 RepID=A0A8S4S6X6_9NEOP|nr:jg3063 [Pararge aegeria aegeria]
MTYGFETWSLTMGLIGKLRVTQRATERAMLGISLRDQMRNEKIRSRTTVTDTSQLAKLKRGLAIFKSDNISTISVLKDVIYNCCVKRNIRADVSCDIPDDYCAISFQNIKDKFKMEYDRNKDIEIKKAIRSLDLNNFSVNDETQHILCNDYVQILKEVDDDAETNFEELIETVKNWYLDWCKLSLNRFYNNEITTLQNALKHCQLEDVQEILIFQNSSLYISSTRQNLQNYVKRLCLNWNVLGNHGHYGC